MANENKETEELLDSLTGSSGIDDLFEDDEQKQLEPFVPKDVPSNPDNMRDDVRYDYSSARSNMHRQIQMLFEAADKALEFARNTESPRAFEVFSQIMNQLTSLNTGMSKFHQDILDLEKKRRALEEKHKENDDSRVTINAQQVFLGTPSDMMEQEGSQAEVRRQEKTIEHDDEDQDD